MNAKKVLDPLSNPALGMLPLVLCVLVDYYTNYTIAFLSGVLLFAVWLGVSMYRTKYSPPYMLIVTGIIFAIYAGCSVFTPLRELYLQYSLTICEILLVLTFSFFNAFKRRIKERVKKKDTDKITQAISKARLNEFFYVAKLYQNVLIIHLSIVLIYSLLSEEYHTEGRSFFICTVLFVIFVLLVIIYEYIRLAMLKRQIASEDWLPIVNETGGVIGRVALSVSQAAKRQYLHPVVRIALIYKGLLYLKERSPRFVFDPNKIDYPFEKYVYYKQTLDDCVKSSLRKGCGVDDLPVRFVFRYLFDTEEAHRLIYLYTCNIQDEETMKRLSLKDGKLWTDKQIEQNLNKGIFCESFEKEYEILKNTILMAERYIKNPESQTGTIV